MCFDHSDCDWYASVQIDSTGTSIRRSTCYECGKRIEMYEWRRFVFMQEHEECRRCELEELDEDDEPCDQHDYGEVFTYARCEDCDKIIRAIEQFELREGCPVYEARPALGELREELNRWNRDDAPRYAAIAIETFPELSAVPWLVDVLIVDGE